MGGGGGGLRWALIPGPESGARIPGPFRLRPTGLSQGTWRADQTRGLPIPVPRGGPGTHAASTLSPSQSYRQQQGIN